MAEGLVPFGAYLGPSGIPDRSLVSQTHPSDLFWTEPRLRSFRVSRSTRRTGSTITWYFPQTCLGLFSGWISSSPARLHLQTATLRQRESKPALHQLWVA